MSKNSTIVVVGKVVRIGEIPTPKNATKSIFDEVAIATIEIEQIIVGIYEDKDINITYYPRLSFEACFVINERSILL